MILPEITELQIIGIYDRGVANQERIAIQAKQSLNLGQYGIMLGGKNISGQMIPYNDNLFWFGDGVVQQGDWLYIYTGPGKARVNDIPGQSEKIYTIHWGKGSTILALSDITPILFRVSAIKTAQPPMNLPQNTQRKILNGLK